MCVCVCVCVHLLAQFISGVLNCEVARGGGKGSREHTTLITERVSASIYRGERVGVCKNFFYIFILPCPPPPSYSLYIKSPPPLAGPARAV